MEYIACAQYQLFRNYIYISVSINLTETLAVVNNVFC